MKAFTNVTSRFIGAPQSAVPVAFDLPAVYTLVGRRNLQQSRRGVTLVVFSASLCSASDASSSLTKLTAVNADGAGGGPRNLSRPSKFL